MELENLGQGILRVEIYFQEARKGGLWGLQKKGALGRLRDWTLGSSQRYWEHKNGESIFCSFSVYYILYFFFLKRAQETFELF